MAKRAIKRAQIPLHNRQEASGHDELGLERLVFFSDAVFAIAITLLALEIRLPAPRELLSESQLLESLLSIWQKYLSYAISFLVIGVFWMGHHRKFRFITRYDSNLLLLNLLLLMTVAFIPFPTSVISEYAGRTATIFYAGVMLVAGLLNLLLWMYAAHRNRLTDPAFPAQQRQHETLRALVVPGVFLLSIGLAFIDPDLAKYSWLLILVVLKLA